MKSVLLDLPTFAFVVGTRAALGVGVGLLVAERLPAERRRAIGASLVALGAVTTIPAAMSVFRSVTRSKRRRANASQRRGLTSSVSRDERLIGVTRFPRKGDDYSG